MTCDCCIYKEKLEEIEKELETTKKDSRLQYDLVLTLEKTVTAKDNRITQLENHIKRKYDREDIG